MQKNPTAQTSSNWQNTLKKQERSDMMRKIAIWGGIIIASVLGMVILVKLAGNSGPSSAPAEVKNLRPVGENDIVLGDPKAKLAIIEYADFQCPSCAAYNPVLNRLLEEFDGKLKLSYRFFPLRSIHKNALIAGQAGYAAQQQGKFKEMKDILFEKQKDWENSKESDAKLAFIGYASLAQMDSAKFEKDMQSKEAEAAVLAGETEALGMGLNSTPTFFLGNKRIQPQGYDEFKKLIESELNASK